MITGQLIRSFSDELAKIAFGPEEAKKVRKVFKSKADPKLGKEWGLSGPAAFRGGRQGAKEIRQHAARNLAQIEKFDPEMAAGMRTLHEAEMPKTIKEVRGTRSFTIPGSVNVLPGAKKLKKKDRKMLKSLVAGHELAEIQTPKWTGADVWSETTSHAHPDVIAREHNMLATLPKKRRKAGKVLRKARYAHGIEGRLWDTATGGRLPFGKGQRLSRHGRKRVSELIHKQMQDPAVQQQMRNFMSRIVG